MKKILLIPVIVCCFYTTLNAQTKLPPVDKSPMDMSYYPSGYPVLKIQDKVTEPLVARVIFSRPQKKWPQYFWRIISLWTGVAIGR